MGQNSEEKIKVLVRSEYWDGPIEVEINKDFLSDKDQCIISTLSQIKDQAKTRTLIEITANLLKSDVNLKFEPISDASREGEQITPAAETIPDTIPPKIDDGTQQTMEYGREEPESPRHKLGYLDPDEIAQLRPKHQHLPPSWRS